VEARARYPEEPAEVPLNPAPGDAHQDRRRVQRRVLPSRRLDVTRIEHENLCDQMDEVVRLMRRLEAEIRAQSQRIGQLEALLRQDPPEADH